MIRLLLTGVALTIATPALAQMDSRDAIALQNQLLELKRDVQALQQGGGRSSGSRPAPAGGGASNDLVASLLDRVNTLEDQQRQLRGQVDQLRNTVQRQQEDFAKQLGDMQFQAQQSQPRQPPPPVLSPPPSGLNAGGPPPGEVRRTPELAMQDGNAALARRDYGAAVAAAKEVLGMPRNPRATDAQFLLAQAEAGQRNYAAAAPDFYDAYSRGRTGAHAQDALLGVANSLIAVNDKPSACAALDKLRIEFPQPRGDVREAAAAARQRAGCR